MCTFIWFCIIINGDSLRHDVREGVGMGMHLGNVPILAVGGDSYIFLVNQVAISKFKGIKK